MSKKVRSVFWIVSTHVLTTGLGVPAVMGIIQSSLISYLRIRDPLLVLYMVSTGSVLGCIGGTLYSLAYLRKEADCIHWKRCTLPSISTFAILTFLGLAFEVYALKASTVLTIGLLTTSSLVSIAAFSVLTSSGFARMPVSEPDVTTASRPQSEKLPAERKSTGSWFRKRLIASGVGFAIGFVVGVGAAIYLAGKGGMPDWQSRLLTGLVVGGIGALLGLVSGNVRL